MLNTIDHHQCDTLKTLNNRKDFEIKKLKEDLQQHKEMLGKLNNVESQVGDVNQIKIEYGKEIKILGERNKTLEEQINLLGEENENLRCQVVEISQALDTSESDLVQQRYVRNSEHDYSLP